VCPVTGATSGIGKATAHALATKGASVVLVGRDPRKGEATVREIRQSTTNEEVELLRADLSSQASIRELADHFLAEHDRLHVLVNCAGAYFRDRRVTIDRLEMSFALNHLAYFLLTTLLLDLLQGSAPARIVNVTSGAQSMGRIDFEDLQGEREYEARLPTTSPSRHRAVHLRAGSPARGQGVTVNCVHPGWDQLRPPEPTARVAADDRGRVAVDALTGEGGRDRRVPRFRPRGRDGHREVLPRPEVKMLLEALVRRGLLPRDSDRWARSSPLGLGPVRQARVGRVASGRDLWPPTPWLNRRRIGFGI
jgi:NAD(P)-dependent dehydrogenase (short-subunit alcohol dehydrogenase family)